MIYDDVKVVEGGASCGSRVIRSLPGNRRPTIREDNYHGSFYRETLLNQAISFSGGVRRIRARNT